ncbi:MAG: S-adenosylmethionine synthetase [Candidatus Woesearchaeota archaeon]|nr:S-adenosylmethionine synthetase [Candidatus Woesearchaeota archaeon]
MKKLITSESVGAGHPDKVCDQVSDAILDAFLEKDPNAHVAVETLASKGYLVIAGEVKSNAVVDIEKVARETIKEIGYDDVKWGLDYKSCGILISVHPQSPDIAQGVDEKNNKEQGAGDQGMMFGYATNETNELMPLPIILAHKLTRRIKEVRDLGILNYLGPDCKSQVTVEYDNNKPSKVKAVVIAAQHDEKVDIEKLREDIKTHVIKPILKDYLTDDTKIWINSTGRFVLGGPAADTGLTGRKIIVDTYGGIGRHGGGAFSGKDPSKVDRSGAYMARYIAKNIVAANLAERCEVQLAYAIGVPEPVGIYIDTFGTGKISDEKLSHIVKIVFPLTPKGIINHLKLKRPIYKKTAAFGHFGRNEPEFTWEKTDLAKILKERAGI